MPYLILYFYIVILSIVTFLAFRWDKQRARRREQRVSEFALLWLALCGGWLGAKAAQYRYRHKIRKQPFKTLINAIPFLYIAGSTAALIV